MSKRKIAAVLLLTANTLGNRTGVDPGLAQGSDRQPPVTRARFNLQGQKPENHEGKDLPGPVQILRPRVGGLYPLAYSPDGKTLATSGGKALGTSGTRSHILLWDPTTGEEKGQLLGRQAPVFVVRALAFSPDSKWLASGDCLGKHGIVHLWEVATGKLERELRVSQGDIDDVAFSPDGRTLAAAETRGKVYLWDANTGKEMHQLRRDSPYSHYHNRYGLAFSPDGKMLAAGGCKVSVWDVASGKRLHQFDSEGNFVAFFPDGKTLVGGGCYFLPGPDGTGRVPHPAIYTWDLSTGRERRLGNWQSVGVVKSLALSPDGRTIVSGGPDRVRLWEVATGKKRRLLGGPGTDHRVESSRGVHLLPHTTNHVVFSPNGRMLATSSDGLDRIFLWDAMVPPSTEGPQTREPSSKELDVQWADLASDDAAKGYRAICILVQWREHSVPFLKERLQQVPKSDPRQIAQLIAELGSERFEARQKAMEELERLGDLAQQTLRKALAGNPSLELRQRVEKLLEKLDGPITCPDRLRVIRGLEVLEHIGTPEATRVLEELSKGTPGTDLTEGAQAAVGRLKKRVPVEP